MKKETLISFLLGVVVALFFLRNCKQTEIIEKEIEVPAVSGSFETYKPIQNQPINIDSLALLVRDTMKPRIKVIKEVVEVASKKNDTLLQAYEELESEVKRKELFATFIQPRSFLQKFEDEYLSAEISGISRGKVENINLDYNIKQRTITKPIEMPKPKKWHIGPYVGFDAYSQDFGVGVGVMYSILSF